MTRPPAEAGDVRHRGQTAVRTTGGATLSAVRRVVALLTLIALAVPAPVALAQNGQGGQGGSGAFGPLPQAPPAETPTPTPPPTNTAQAQQDTDRTLLFAIAGALLVLFIVIARVITRDARGALRTAGVSDDAPRRRDEGPHRHAKQTKAKARARTKAQRRARRQNR